MDCHKADPLVRKQTSTEFPPHPTFCDKLITYFGKLLGFDLQLKSQVKVSKLLFQFYSNANLKHTRNKGKIISLSKKPHLCFALSLLVISRTERNQEGQHSAGLVADLLLPRQADLPVSILDHRHLPCSQFTKLQYQNAQKLNKVPVSSN